MVEEWVQVQLYERNGELITLDGYYIEKNTLQIKNMNTGRIAIPSIGSNKYVYVSFTYNGRHPKRSVHRIVASTFIHNPDPKNRTHVNHKNEIQGDNRIENLEWVTPSQNNMKIYEGFGRNGTTAKLTGIQVKEVEELLKEGKFTHQHIADVYGVTRKVIGNINTGKSYKRITKRMQGDNLRDSRKLTKEQALEIYNLANSSKLSQSKIGKQYGVSRDLVSDIKRGRCWRSVTGHQNGRKAKSVAKNTKQITENVTTSYEHVIGEDWKDVQLYLNGKFVKIDGYKANLETQQVKSFKQDKVNGRILTKGARCKYPIVSLQIDKKSRVLNLHKVMMDTFKPENVDTLPIINHINGEKADDRLENLERCTHSYNTKQAYDVLGHKARRGEECPASKLTDIQVKEIDKLLHEGKLTQQQIADKCGVKRTAVKDIYNGKAWSHLTGRLNTSKNTDKKYVGKASSTQYGLKLTEEQILSIYNDAWHGGLTRKEIAKKHGVSENIVKCIKLGTTHSYITGKVKASSKNYSLNLTEEKILETYNDAWHSGLKLKEVGRRHGVSNAVVDSIKLGKTHSNVTGHDKASLKNYSSKLTIEKILEIYNDAWHTELTLKEIGRKHGVSNHIVDSIKLGKTHSNVTGHVRGVKLTKISDTTLDDFF